MFLLVVGKLYLRDSITIEYAYVVPFLLRLLVRTKCKSSCFSTITSRTYLWIL